MFNIQKYLIHSKGLIKVLQGNSKVNLASQLHALHACNLCNRTNLRLYQYDI